MPNTDALSARSAAPPRAPADPDRFSSDTRFAHEDERLDEVRERFAVVPVRSRS